MQRRASNSGVIMVAGQKIALGRIHARKMVSVRNLQAREAKPGSDAKGYAAEF